MEDENGSKIVSERNPRITEKMVEEIRNGKYQPTAEELEEDPDFYFKSRTYALLGEPQKVVIDWNYEITQGHEYGRERDCGEGWYWESPETIRLKEYISRARGEERDMIVYSSGYEYDPDDDEALSFVLACSMYKRSNNILAFNYQRPVEITFINIPKQGISPMDVEPQDEKLKSFYLERIARETNTPDFTYIPRQGLDAFCSLMDAAIDTGKKDPDEEHLPPSMFVTNCIYLILLPILLIIYATFWGEEYGFGGGVFFVIVTYLITLILVKIYIEISCAGAVAAVNRSIKKHDKMSKDDK